MTQTFPVESPRSSGAVVMLLALAYAASLPFEIVVTPLGRTASSILFVPLFFFWCLDKIVLRQRAIAAVPTTLVVVLIVWATMTAFWSHAPGVSVVSIMSLAASGAAFVVLLDLVPGRVHRFVGAYCHGCVGLALLLLAESRDALASGRVTLGDADENLTAFVLVLGLSLTLSAILNSSGGPRIYWYMAAGLQMFATLLTGSRTGLIATVVICFTVLLFSVLSRRNRSKVRELTLVVALLAAFFAARAWDRLPTRLEVYFTGAAEYSDPVRSWITGLYFAHADKWLLTGVGYGADAAFLQVTTAHYWGVHSTFLKIWVELGLPGLIAFGSIIGYVGLAAIRGRRLDIALPTLLPFLIFSITLGGLELRGSTWFGLAIAMSANQYTAWRDRSARGIATTERVSPQRSDD